MNRKEIFKWVLNQFGTEPDYPWMDTNAVLRHSVSGKWYGVILTVRADRLGIDSDKSIDVLNVKCDNILIGGLIQQDGYYPAYHMNKKYWISVLLDGTVPESEIKDLISYSYELTKPKIMKKNNM